MPNPRHSERPSRLGYIAAIAVSAAGHALLLTLLFFVLPQYLHSDSTPPPTYTVKIVDNLPAGDLGTHLPKLSSRPKPPPKPEQLAKAEEPEPPKIEPPKPPAPVPESNDKNAILLSTKAAPTSTPTPTPPPTPTRPSVEPTPGPTVAPTPEPTVEPTATKVPTPLPTPTPKPTPKVARPRPTATPKVVHKKKPVVIARNEPTPSVQEQLAKIRQQLLAEHLKKNKQRASEEEGEEESSTASPRGEPGSGPVVANVGTAGKGYGIGPGTGSVGIQNDLEFLLYYRTVQERIKKAWNFPGGSSDLTTTVEFSIGADGNLLGVKIVNSSKDSAFDDSVLRAIRRAAPFPVPPQKYRSQFASGIEALFKLGELKS